MQQDNDEDLSAYELERRENIRQNNLRLQQLGLDPPAPARTSFASRPTTKKRAAPAIEVAEPVRRSSRFRVATSLYTDDTPFPQSSSHAREPSLARPYEAPDDDGDLEDSRANAELPLREPAERAPPAKGSARDVKLDAHAIIDRYLGKPVADLATKNAAVEAMAFRRNVSFSKYSGCLEWRNAIVLWVNIGGKEYKNVFFDGGARMTWYASERNHEATPVVQRLISGKEPVLLFCRLPSEPYICCGRLAYVRHVPGRQPLKFEWGLSDLPVLKESAAF